LLLAISPGTSDRPVPNTRLDQHALKERPLTYALYGWFFVLAAYGMFAFMKYAARVESLTE